MRFGSLFSGIGGLDLGLERAGMECAWQVEIDPYARRVLERHWPDIDQHEDVRQVCGRQCDDGPGHLAPVDLICGGFPCQDISTAGHRAGIDGTRSGLWGEYVRLIRELRPRYVLVENVAALLGRGMGRVLGDLAELGFDAEWSVLPACAVGAPHLRERVFIVAHAHGEPGAPRMGHPVRSGEQVLACRERPSRREWMAARPPPRGVAHGIPDWVERLRGLGNAVVPQVAELIGRRILQVAP